MDLESNPVESGMESNKRRKARKSPTNDLTKPGMGVPQQQHGPPGSGYGAPPYHSHYNHPPYSYNQPPPHSHPPPHPPHLPPQQYHMQHQMWQQQPPHHMPYGSGWPQRQQQQPQQQQPMYRQGGNWYQQNQSNPNQPPPSHAPSSAPPGAPDHRPSPSPPMPQSQQWNAHQQQPPGHQWNQNAMGPPHHHLAPHHNQRSHSPHTNNMYGGRSPTNIIDHSGAGGSGRNSSQYQQSYGPGGVDEFCKPINELDTGSLAPSDTDRISHLDRSIKDRDKGRGSYRCGRCGVPKKGHVCPYQPKLKRRPEEPPPEMRTTSTQVEMDEHMILRRLNMEIQGFPESYITDPNDMVGAEAATPSPSTLQQPTAPPPNTNPYQQHHHHHTQPITMNRNLPPPHHSSSSTNHLSPIPTHRPLIPSRGGPMESTFPPNSPNPASNPKASSSLQHPLSSSSPLLSPNATTPDILDGSVMERHSKIGRIS